MGEGSKQRARAPEESSTLIPVRRADSETVILGQASSAQSGLYVYIALLQNNSCALISSLLCRLANVWLGYAAPWTALRNGEAILADVT
jgi:hypothetical protein